MTLDDPRLYEERDPHRVREVLAAFSTQCREALALVPEPPVRRARPTLVVVAGMGGSAVGGDLLAACAAEHLGVPVVVHRGYGLPAPVSKQALVLASSYSGETAEVLSAVETALARGAAVAALTSGGRLAQLALTRRLPLVKLPAGLMPRMALGYLFLPTVRILARVGLPVVVGTSRKGFIGRITGETEAAQRLFGTAATVAWSAANGASIVRVHDVRAMSQVVRMIGAIQSGGGMISPAPIAYDSAAPDSGGPARGI